MNEAVIVRTGVSVPDTVVELRQLAMEASSAVVGGGRPIERVRDDYLAWVERAEEHLRSRLSSESAWQGLHSERYWQVYGLRASSPRPFPVVAAEARWQADRLNTMADDLQRGQQQLQTPPGCVPVVPDTNVLVHCRRYDEIPWPRVVGAQAVRLVVLLIVLDELDRLSYRSRQVGERARGVLRSIRQLRDEVPPEQPVEVRDGVTMQVLMDPPRHVRVENSDAEVMRRVEDVSALTGGSSILLTGDYGMQLRASSRGIHCCAMPDEFRLIERMDHEA